MSETAKEFNVKVYAKKRDIDLNQRIMKGTNWDSLGKMLHDYAVRYSDQQNKIKNQSNETLVKEINRIQKENKELRDRIQNMYNETFADGLISEMENGKMIREQLIRYFPEIEQKLKQ